MINISKTGCVALRGAGVIILHLASCEVCDSETTSRREREAVMHISTPVHITFIGIFSAALPSSHD